MSNSIAPFYIQEPTEFRNNDMYTLYAQSGIPIWSYKYVDKMDKLNLKKQYKQIFDDYINNLADNILSGRHMVIYSKPDKSGTGKSTVLFNIAMKAVQAGFSGGCFYYSDLVALFRSGLADSDLKMEFKRFVQDKDFILIDALGSGYTVKKEYAISGLSDLIYYADTGVSHRVPIFISSIIGADALQTQMDNSAYSKFYTNHIFIELTGEDIRL